MDSQSIDAMIADLKANGYMVDKADYNPQPAIDKLTDLGYTFPRYPSSCDTMVLKNGGQHG